jgi:zinc protease
VVAGDVTREALEALVQKHFGDWTGKIAPHVEVGTPRAQDPVLAVVDRPGAPQTVVVIGTRGPSADDPDYFAREVVNTAFGGSFASRLNHRLREELGYTYGVYSGFWRGDWAGSWSVSTSLETGVTVDGVKEILAILKQSRSEELPAEELEKTQQLMTRSLPQDYESDGQIAGQFAALLVVRRPLDFYQGWVAGVRAVTAAQARAAAAASWKDLDMVVVGDWKKIGKGLSALGLAVVHYDADGHVVE